MTINRHAHYPSGVAALLVVVTLGAAAAILALSATRLGLGELDLGYMTQRAGGALSLADGCLEEVLLRLRQNPNYGIGGVPFGVPTDEGSCTMTVVDLGGGLREITAEGIIDVYRRKIQVDVNLLGSVLGIERWEEMTN